MIRTVNNKDLRQEVWNFINLEKREKPLLIWAQYGCYAIDDVQDVVDTHRHSTTPVYVAYNDSEAADIKAFLDRERPKNNTKTRLICVSLAPFENTLATVEALSEGFDAIILQPEIEDWLGSHRHLQPPIAGFLRKHPEYFCLPFGETPKPNAAGYNPAVWEEVGKFWSDIWFELWDESPLHVKRKVKVHNMMFHAALSIGSYKKLLHALQRYIIWHRSWNDVERPVRPFFDSCNGPVQDTPHTKEEPKGATFSDVIETLSD